MKRIGILSDTHGHWDSGMEKHLRGCDEIWHAGDVGDPFILDRLSELAPVVRAVRGNVDCGMVARSCPEVMDFETEGVRVSLRHIGGYPTRYAPGVKNHLRQQRAKLFVCGHSHILKVMPDAELDLLHVNPGAAGQQGWQRVRTLVRLTLDAGDIRDLEVVEMRGGAQ